jgi:glutamyl-Q tRNA(Asp) synthetase
MVAALPYRGRFAPTPSGPLHLGSLVAALASYLDARAHHGDWLVRIEDIDEPRSVPGAAELILEQLQDHGLVWQSEVIWQSQRKPRYQQILEQLQQAQLTYRCQCTRQQIKARGAHYDGYCRERQVPPGNHAVRFRNNGSINSFSDRLLGLVSVHAEAAAEDFVLFRRDGLLTYQLAVVVDDIDQHITDIVRGADLIEATPWQLLLWQQLSDRQPRFAHVPLVTDALGRKLSKQNHAPALSAQRVVAQLQQACSYLQLPLHGAQTRSDILQQATVQWQRRCLP